MSVQRPENMEELRLHKKKYGHICGKNKTPDPTPEEIARMCLEIRKGWAKVKYRGHGRRPVDGVSERMNVSCDRRLNGRPLER